MKERLDVLLVKRNLAESREKAKAIIMSGNVFVEGQREDKAGSTFPEEVSIEVRGHTLPYVSRGGLKLEKAIANFDVSVKDKVCTDVGSSTGGFTDCMLQNGAKKVFAIDVGRGQLDWKLRNDPRVICMEKTNIRYVTPEDLGVGILYNKKMVDEPVDSWNILWDEKYTDSILMQDSVRDAFAVALKSLGYSLNSTDLDELEAAKKLLIKQKPLVQAYVIDQVRDKMIGNEAALGVIYSGEALYCQKENPDLEYVIPKEGSNLWIDALVIPKNAQNKKNAEAFINYLCRPDIAKMNFDYITYSIPNSAGRELIEDESMRESNIAFPDISQLKNCETFNFLGDENEIIYNQLWREIKSK